MIGSPEINKVIRRTLSPVLRESGFARTQTRNNWGWHGPCTWVLNICAVGHYFNLVTGWPSMSVGVCFAVMYDFIPPRFPDRIKTTPQGKLLPQYFQCEQSQHLDVGINQRKYTLELGIPAERARTDIWWIERDGSNMEGAIEDIARQFVVQAFPWFERKSDIPAAYAENEAGLDCLGKFSRGAYFAKYLKREDEFRGYVAKLEQEAHRIEHPMPVIEYGD